MFDLNLLLNFSEQFCCLECISIYNMYNQIQDNNQNLLKIPKIFINFGAATQHVAV